jgi:hypothetical protein
VGLFEDWCTKKTDEKGAKRYWLLVEKPNGRDGIRARLAEVMRSHYDRLEMIAEDVASLGYAGAANILRERLPRNATSRSGDLGEILGTELVEETTNFRIPVRRLRHKDGREMALRGDDFIGIGYDSNNKLWLLKGEAKSALALGAPTIRDAREVLMRDDGHCTPHSLLFVADRLLQSAVKEELALGRTIRNGIGDKTIHSSRVDHMMFTFSGNAPPPSLKADLDAAEKTRNHYVINLRVEDHQEFIEAMYEETQNLGND